MLLRAFVMALLGSTAFAQSEPERVTVSLVASYPSDTGLLRDHAHHLATLQRRFKGARLVVKVELPMAAAVRHMDTKPPYTVAGGVPSKKVVLKLEPLAGVGDWVASDPDLFADLMAASLLIDADRQLQLMTKAYRNVQREIEDGPGKPYGTARFVELFPHSGYARACRYVDDLWYRGDLEAARADADAALRALAAESWPLVRFCDLALRADPHGPELARAVLAALQPVLQASPEAVLARLCSLRAMLRVDASTVGAAEVAAIWPSVEADGDAALQLAEILAGAPDAARFRDDVERALAVAAKGGVEARLLAAARWKAAVHIAGDEAAGQRCLADLLGKAAEPYACNSAAWRLLVEFATMGRFDDVALALMQQAAQQSRDGLSDALMDTMALAMFGNGRFGEAIELETKAIESSDGDPRYAARLRRYEHMRDAARKH